jgi:hypothetical protein
MRRTRGASASLLLLVLPAMGVGFWLTAALSRPAAAQKADIQSCGAALRACSDMLADLQRQRDAAIAASTKCQTALSDANLKLALLEKSKVPGGLTHRDALSLIDLSMNVLQDAAESDISPAELIAATRSLRLYQTKANGLSLKLTQRATQASQSTESP